MSKTQDTPKQKTKFTFPLTRHQFSDKYYIMVFNNLNKAEILKVTNPKLVNDFLLGAGMKTVRTFEAESPRKAYFKAKRKLQRILQVGV
jgi:hypothetical protein